MSSAENGIREEGIQDSIYRDKLAHLQSELCDLDQKNHPEYVAGMELLKQRLRVRQEYNEAVKSLEIELAHKWCEREETAAIDDFECKKSDLLVTMLNDLEEKRKQIEHEYSAMDLNNDCSDLKPIPTRKLRRRPNDPVPCNDKRARITSPTLIMSLPESDIASDLQLISAGGKISDTLVKSQATCSSRTPPSTGRSIISSGDTHAHMDSNKLYYLDKCYVKGQSVTIDTSSVGKWNGIINNMSNNEMTVRNATDGGMMVVTLCDLRQGRAILKKKT